MEGHGDYSVALFRATDLGNVAEVRSLVKEYSSRFDQDPVALAQLLSRAHRHPAILAAVVATFNECPAFSAAAQLWASSIKPTVDMEYDKSISAVMKRMEKALYAFARGEFVIVVDAHDRENEGDLIIAAEFCTTAQMAFMVNQTSGLICAPMSQERADELELPLMVDSQANRESHKTAFTISVDLSPVKHRTTTGISAEDRGRTLMALADRTKFDTTDFVRPGHIFPLRAKEGGVFVRPGHTEAGVDLCKMAGLSPVSAICEITKPDGTMARLPDLLVMAEQYALQLIAIEDMIAYRRITEAK